MDVLNRLITFAVGVYLLNAGYLLVLPMFIAGKKDYDLLKSYIQPKSAPAILGTLGLALGGVRLVLPLSPPVILGDLIPAIAAAVVGATHLLGYVRNTDRLSESEILEGTEFLNTLQIPLGFGSMFVAVLHVLFGGIPLL